MAPTPTERERSPLPLRGLLLRGLPLAVICASGCALLAFTLSDRRESVYEAQALVLMRQVADPVSNAASPLDEGEGISTDALLVGRRAVLERAARRTRGLTFSELQGAVTVAPAGKTDALRVSAEANQADKAALIANSVARTYVAMQRESTRERARRARAILRRQLRGLSDAAQSSLQASQLRDRIQSLGILMELGSTAPRIISEAEPPAAATSPTPRRDGVFGGIFGFVLGIGLAALWVVSDRRIRNPEEASEIFGVPTLSTFRTRGALPGMRRTVEADAQAWRLLHLSLRSSRDQAPLRTVSVTAAGGGQGRSRVAWGLASTAAAAGERALLVVLEPDVRGLNGQLSTVDGHRLGALLAGDATLGEAVSQVGSAEKGARQLDVVVGDRNNGDPAALIESPRLRNALRGAAAAYDLVVIDTPSVMERPEGVPVISEADATLVVLPGDIDRERLVSLRGRLEALDAHVVGLVLSSG